MDLGSFFGTVGNDIGNFFGGIFGNDQQKKKQVQQPVQPQLLNPGGNQPQSTFSFNNQTPATVQAPKPFDLNNPENKPPVIGGVTMHPLSPASQQLNPVQQQLAQKFQANAPDHQIQSAPAQPVAPQPSFLQNLNDFAGSANSAAARGLIGGVANGVNLFRDGFDTNKMNEDTNNFLNTIHLGNTNQNRSGLASNVNFDSTPAKVGGVIGNIEGGLNPVTPVLDGTAAIGSTLGATLASNDLMDKGYNPNDIMSASDAYTAPYGIDSTKSAADNALAMAGNAASLGLGLAGADGLIPKVNPVKAAVENQLARSVARTGIDPLVAPAVSREATQAVVRGGMNPLIRHLEDSVAPVETEALPASAVSNEASAANEAASQVKPVSAEPVATEPTPAPRDPNSPITSSPTTAKEPAITSANPNFVSNKPTVTTPEPIFAPETPNAAPAIKGVEPLTAPTAGAKAPVVTPAEKATAEAQAAIDKAATAPQPAAPEVASAPTEAPNVKAAKQAAEQAPPPVTPEQAAAIAKQAEHEAPTAAAADEVATNPDAVSNINAIKRAFRAKTNIFRDTNTDAGHELADTVENKEADKFDMTSKRMDQLKDFFKLSDADKETAWRVQEGEIKPKTVSPEIAKAAADLREAMPSIHKEAVDAGIETGDLGKTYMPHVFAKDGPTVKMSQDATSNARKYGNLEKERTSDGSDYQRTGQVLQDYIDRTSERIAAAKHFGVNNEVAKGLIDRIGAEGGDSNLADKAFTNYYSPSSAADGPLKNFSKSSRVLQSALKLPLAFISHATQGVNPAVDTGILNTLKATGKTILQSPETKDMLSKSGVLTPQSLDHYSQEYTSFGGKLANKVTAPLLKPVMKFNRSVAANAYDSAAAKMAAKGDVQGLRDLNVKGDINDGALTPQQRLEAIRGGVKRTMFMNTAADTPVDAETPLGRAFWQYRGAYARPQTAFIYNHVLKPAMEGHLAPLARYATVGTAAAAAPVMVKNAIAGRPNDPGSVAGTVLPQMAGLPGETANSLIQYGPKDPVGTTASIIAPAAGEAVKLVNAVGQSAAQKSPTPLERFGLKEVPVVGSRLAANLTPTKAQQDAANNPSQQPSSGSNPIADFVNGIFNPKPADPAVTEMQRLANDNGVKFTTAESNALKSKNVNPLAQSLINDPLYQNADDQSKLSMLKNVMHGTATKGINSTLADGDKQALLDYNVQNATDKKAWLDDNHNASKYYTALYNNAVANKSIDPKLDNDLASKTSLKYKMVAAQVDEKYNNGDGASPELKTTYAGTSMAKFTALLNPKSATYDPQAAEELAKYDQARVDAGLPAKYNMDVINKSLNKAASAGIKKQAFAFPSLPTSMSGTASQGGSGTGGGYAKDAPLFTPLPDLKVPVGAPIPRGRTISVTKVR